MALLAYTELQSLVEAKVITNVHPDAVNSSSIDLTLGSTVLIEDGRIAQLGANVVELKKRKPLNMVKHDLAKWPLYLAPGQFVLAQTEQMFYLPADISGEYKLKSSMARIGLEHLNAGWCDAGWNGSVLTLELKNMTQHHTIVLNHGDAIGQMVFFKHAAVPAEKNYAARGRYNNDPTVIGIKK